MEKNILLNLKMAKNTIKSYWKIKKTGTEINFLPSKEVFSSTKFSSKYNTKKNA